MARSVIIKFAVAAILLAGVIWLFTRSDAEKTPPATSAPVMDNAASDTPTPTKGVSSDGLYQAECMTPQGTMIGQVQVDADEDPAAQKTLSIKNMNTGKSTKIDMSDADCAFMPLKK